MKRLVFHRLLVVFGLGLALGAAGCSTDAIATTGGRRITLATRVRPPDSVGDEFTTGKRWNVKLTSAHLAIGGLYYFDGQPAFARITRDPLDRLRRFVIGTAYAHPQHYQAGNALGEMIDVTSVDLFRPARLPEGQGVTGTFRSGRILLPETISGPSAEELGGHVAAATGVAQKDGKTVHFSVSADLPDIQRSSPNAEIDGCVFEEAEVSTDGTVTLTVTPSVWFNLVDFEPLEPGSEEAPTEIVRGDIAHKAFALGVVQLSAYRFTYTP